MNPVRVILADDHPVVRAGLAALLDSLTEIEVVAVAANGRDAVKEAVLQRPDVAILDLQMPEMDGYQTARAIRSMPRFERCPSCQRSRRPTSRRRPEITDEPSREGRGLTDSPRND